jgi:hypothetical protein
MTDATLRQINEPGLGTGPGPLTVVLLPYAAIRFYPITAALGGLAGYYLSDKNWKYGLAGGLGAATLRLLTQTQSGRS